MRTYLVLLWIGSWSVACKTSSHAATSAPDPIFPTTHQAYSAAEVQQLLVVQDLKVTTIALQNNQWPQISFRRSPQAEYIRYEACLEAEPTQCIKGDLIAALELTITGLKPGVNTIAVYACVRKDQVEAMVPDSCGDPALVRFLQSGQGFQELDDAITERSVVEQKILVYGQTLYNSILLFKANHGSCADPKIQSFISADVMDKYLALGPHFIGVGLEDPTAQIISGDGSDGHVVFTLQAETTTLQSGSSDASSESSSDGGGSSALEKGFGVATLTTIGLYGLKHALMGKLTKSPSPLAEKSPLGVNDRVKILPEAKQHAVEAMKTGSKVETKSLLAKNPGALIVVGLVVLNVIIDKDHDPFNSLGLAATSASCVVCEDAVKTIVDVNAQTKTLRSELQQIDQKIQSLTNSTPP